MTKDPLQYTNLSSSQEHRPVVDRFQRQLAAKLRKVRDNDLGRK